MLKDNTFLVNSAREMSFIAKETKKVAVFSILSEKRPPLLLFGMDRTYFTNSNPNFIPL